MKPLHRGVVWGGVIELVVFLGIIVVVLVAGLIEIKP
jgi:hypothetical protein